MDIEPGRGDRKAGVKVPRPVIIWLWIGPPVLRKASSRRRNIPLAEDQNERISDEGRCTGVNNNRSVTRRRKNRNRRRTLAKSLRWWRFEPFRTRPAPGFTNVIWTNKEIPLTTRESMTEKANYLYCKEVPNIGGKPWFLYSYNKNGILLNLDQTCWIDGAQQKVVSKSLRAFMLYLVQYSVFPGQPGKRLYDTRIRTYFWLYMASHAYPTIADYQLFGGQGTRTGHQKRLQPQTW